MPRLVLDTGSNNIDTVKRPRLVLDTQDTAGLATPEQERKWANSPASKLQQEILADQRNSITTPTPPNIPEIGLPFDYNKTKPLSVAEIARAQNIMALRRTGMTEAEARDVFNAPSKKQEGALNKTIQFASSSAFLGSPFYALTFEGIQQLKNVILPLAKQEGITGYDFFANRKVSELLPSNAPIPVQLGTKFTEFFADVVIASKFNTLAKASLLKKNFESYATKKGIKIDIPKEKYQEVVSKYNNTVGKLAKGTTVEKELARGQKIQAMKSEMPLTTTAPIAKSPTGVGFVPKPAPPAPQPPISRMITPSLASRQPVVDKPAITPMPKPSPLAAEARKDELELAKLINNPSRLSIDERLKLPQSQVKMAEQKGERLLKDIKEGGADKAKLFFRSTDRLDYSDRAEAGIFFANDFGISKNYAGDIFTTKPSKMIVAELNIKKPYYTTKDEIEYHASRRNEWVKKLKAKGYDSIVEKTSKNPNDMGYDVIPTEVAVFDKNQIKQRAIIENPEGRNLSSEELYNRIKSKLSPLAQEAKPLITFSDKQITQYKTISTPQGEAPRTMGAGIYFFSEGADISKGGSFGKIKNEAYLKPETKIIDVGEFNLTKGGKYIEGSFQKVVDKVREIAKNEGKDIGLFKRFIDKNIGREQLPAMIKELGYDGIRVGDQTVIYNADKLLTKSQLTDIWNKATGKAAKPSILGEERGTVVIPGEEKEFAGNILLNKYPEEVRVKLRELYKQHPEAFETPVIPMEFIKKMAEENPQKYFSEIFKAPEGVVAAEAFRIRSEFAKAIMKADMDINEVFTKAAEARRAGSELGRGLKQMTQVTNEEIAAIQKLDAQIDATKDPAVKAMLIAAREVASKGKKQLDRTIWNQLYEVWVNGILSSPDTHIVNTVSNIVFALTKPAEKFSYALADLPFRVLTGNKEFYFSEVPAELIGATFGLKEGVKNFIGAFTHTVGISKLEERLPMISGLKGKIIRVPTKFLQAEDEFFKGVVGSMERYSQATKMAKKQGLKGKAMYSKIADLINNPTPEMLKAIQAEKLYRTFQDPLSKYTSSIMSLRNRIPGVRYIIPFLRTPVNLAKRSLERTPLGVIKIGVKMTHDEPYTQAEKVKDISHFLVGSAISTAVALSVMESKITGRGPKEKGKRDLMYTKGWQPYSVLINDKYYPYGRIEPLGTSIGFIADIVEKAIAEKKDITPSQASDAVALLANQLINKTYLSGVSSFMDAVLDPKRYGDRWIQRAASGTIPYSGTLRYTAKAMDTTVRQPEGIKQSLMANLPGLSKKVPPRMNVFGEVAERPSGIGSRLTPFDVTKKKEDFVASELLRLAKAISYPSKNLGRIKLSQNEYNQLLRTSGQETKTILYRLMSNPNYQKFSDEQKIKVIENAVSLIRQVNWTKLKIKKLLPFKTKEERIQQYRNMRK